MLQDNDLLAFFWRLHERLRRETFERGRDEADIARGATFSLTYLMQDTGKGTKPAAIRLAQRLEKLSVEMTDTVASGWCFGVIRFEVGENRWTCIWPKWAELQERRPQYASRKRPEASPDVAPEERKRDERKREEMRGKEDRNPAWTNMVSLWDRETDGEYGSLRDWLPEARKFFKARSQNATDEEVVHEAARRAGLRRSKEER
ncbi:MAG: hypothetical protein GY725_17840 [bacterium]|nr:hypothetical protein [bacterium]